MAVAWSKDKVGKASGDVIVRDPVVLTATLPRFLRTGDRGAVQLDLDNVEGAAGDYSVAVSSEGAVKLDGDKPQTLKLAAKQRDRRLGAGDRPSGAGASTIDVSVSGPERLCARARLCARRAAGDADPGAPHACARSRQGETLTLSNDMFADFVPGTGRVGALGRDLDRARCRDAAERARPLSVRLLRADHQPRDAAALRQRAGRRRRSSRSTATSISASRTPSQRLLARQGSNGSFGLWSVGGDDAWLDAYVTDFLTRARERGFEVPADGVQAGARPAAQFRRDRAGAEQERRPRSRLCALCAGAQRRGAGRRPALHRRHQARRPRDADRQGADRRGARHARRQGARRARLRRRARRIWRRSRSSTSAATITARRCATPRRW